MKIKGQQEIVGFVLIVVLVVVGLMVFLIISLKDSPVDDDSVVVVNILDAVMKHTTDCPQTCFSCSSLRRRLTDRPALSVLLLDTRHLPFYSPIS